MERPAFGTLLAGGGRPAAHGALAAVEAGQVSAARKGGPDDAVAVDVDSVRKKSLIASNALAFERRFVHFGAAGRRRIRTAVDTDQLPGHANGCEPSAA